MSRKSSARTPDAPHHPGCYLVPPISKAKHAKWQADEIDDSHISVRFKHGIHTIYLFIDSLAPFSEVTAELLEVLRERYPRGLTTSLSPPKNTAVPEDSADIVAYGVLSVPNDPSGGWKKLKVQNGDVTPTKLGLKNNSLVAFAFVDDEDDEVDFEVEWPREDEELYEAQ